MAPPAGPVSSRRRFRGLRWFRRLSQSRAPEDWHDPLRVFLKDLGEGQTPDWQIRQAADAVSLYCGKFHPPQDHLRSRSWRFQPSRVLSVRALLASEPRMRSDRSLANRMRWHASDFNDLGRDQGAVPPVTSPLPAGPRIRPPYVGCTGKTRVGETYGMGRERTGARGALRSL